MKAKSMVGGGVVRSLLQRGMKRPGGYARLTVRGSCMAPLIQDGDRVTVTREGARLKPGDIVLVRTPTGAWRCHRLLAARFRGYSLAGDRASPITHHAHDEILGKVVQIDRDGRILHPDRVPFAYLAHLLANLRLRAAQATPIRNKTFKLMHGLLCELLCLQWYISLKNRGPRERKTMSEVRP